MERIDIIRRLRKKQSIRSIKRDTGLARETIRDVRDKAACAGWLTSEHLPTERQIAERFKNFENSLHPLDDIKDKIQEWVAEGYTYVVITHLAKKYGYSYNEITIRRYINTNLPKYKHPVIRRYFKPGDTAEVDFGYLGIMYDQITNRKRKVWIFSLRLNYSRKAYREVVMDQKAPTFFACHIHAFEYLGGVPKKIVCDNLKAAVIKACINNPLINKAYRMLALHYDFLINPCLPQKPEHKGGVEKDMSYVKRNFLPIFKEDQKLKGNTIPILQECVPALENWCLNTDDKHTVKYTHSTPDELFAEESSYLISLPLGRWDIVEWNHRKVDVDWKIGVSKAFYSVPYKYIGKEVTAYINSMEVVIFYNYDEIARHPRAKRDWERKIKPEHAPPNQEAYLQTNLLQIIT